MKVKKLELKQCPFCGGAAELESIDKNVSYKVVCQDIHCIANCIYMWFKTPGDAINEWNKRADV